MNTRLPLIILLLNVCIFTSYSKTDANIPPVEESTNSTYDYLEYLCKTWGFVKYFHSEVSLCFEDWDDALIETIPLVMQATDDNEFNQILLDLLDQAGPMAEPTSEPPEVQEELSFNLDIDWMNNASILSEEVMDTLLNIMDKFRPHLNCYVGEAWAGGNPVFEEDDAYYLGSPAYPILEHRLLALFRYWNIIRYYSPYNDVIDQDWEETLPEFIPRIVEASDATEYHLAFKEMTVKLDDAHNFFISTFFSIWDGVDYPPFRVKFLEGKTVISQVTNGMSTLKIGDVITKIDGEDIQDRRAALLKYAHGGNEAVKNRNLNQLLLWGPSGSFEIEIENEDGTQTVNLTRNGINSTILTQQAENVPVMWDTITSGGCHYGYVHMGLLEVDQIPNLFNQFTETDAIIFDIRNYPNGTLWTLVNYLFSDPIHIASFTVPDIRFPGTLFWHEETIGTGSSSPYEGQLIILFNEDTQSQAEYTIMGLEQHPGSLKIGSTTAAADGNVTQVYLPGRIRTYFTGLGTFYPDRTPTQRIGIIPDEEVLPTINGIRGGRDELLEFVFQGCELVGTEEIVAKESPFLKVYPLPFNQELNIEWKNRVQTGNIELIDLYGKLLKHYSFTNETQMTWSLSDLPGGTYIIRMVTEDEIYAQKVIRQ